MNASADNLPKPHLRFDGTVWRIRGPIGLNYTSFTDCDGTRIYWRWLAIFATAKVHEITNAVYHDGVYGLCPHA